MAGQEQGCLRRKIFGQLPAIGRCFRIKAGGRLVEDEQGRPGQGGLGKPDALALAFRQGLDQLLVEAVDVTAFGGDGDGFPRLATGQSAQPYEKFQLLPHKPMARQGIGFGNIADVLPCLGAAGNFSLDVEPVAVRCEAAGADATAG
mgnify:CR=1 FL=1